MLVFIFQFTEQLKDCFPCNRILWQVLPVRLSNFLAFITNLFDCKLVNNKWLLNSFNSNRFFIGHFDLSSGLKGSNSPP